MLWAIIQGKAQFLPELLEEFRKMFELRLKLKGVLRGWRRQREAEHSWLKTLYEQRYIVVVAEEHGGVKN